MQKCDLCLGMDSAYCGSTPVPSTVLFDVRHCCVQHAVFSTTHVSLLPFQLILRSLNANLKCILLYLDFVSVVKSQNQDAVDDPRTEFSRSGMHWRGDHCPAQGMKSCWNKHDYRALDLQFVSFSCSPKWQSWRTSLPLRSGSLLLVLPSMTRRQSPLWSA